GRARARRGLRWWRVSARLVPRTELEWPRGLRSGSRAPLRVGIPPVSAGRASRPGGRREATLPLGRLRRRPGHGYRRASGRRRRVPGRAAPPTPPRRLATGFHAEFIVAGEPGGKIDQP